MKLPFSPNKRGAALIIVLAFLVILSGIVVAYLSRTTTDRQLAHGSFNNVKADELAKSALELTIGDLKQEIANGATITNSNVVPQRSPKPSFSTVPAITNLIRRSVRSDAIPPPAIPSKASAVNSTSDVSANGRSVSLTRWNSHYMVPKSNTSDNSSDPITTGFSGPNYWSPDWVIVTRNGPTAFLLWTSTLADPTTADFAIGRYAYAIYDEGGMLDANVVALPSPTPSVTDIGRKGSPALADLTAMRYTPAGTSATATAISKIAGWRNYATAKSSGTFPNLLPTDVPSFVTFALDQTRDFKTVAATLYLGRTDQAFGNRRELIEYFRSSSSSFNLLQFLGTFSREKNIPTWKPASSTASITQRFSITRLGLVKDAPAAAQKADIQKYFGLSWVDGTPGNDGPPLQPAIPGHWQYVGSTGNNLRNSIPAFTSDPEFFQLFNFAMFSTNADDSAHIATTLGIGAAAIDQYDDDTSADPLTGTTTTMIEYSGGWAVGAENVDPARSPTPAPAGMSPTPRPTVTPYPMLNRPFRNAGELGYALKAPGPQTVDFDTAGSTDGPILDFFTYNTAPVRAGIANLNTVNPAVIAAILKGAITNESTSAKVGPTPSNNAAISPTPNPISGVVGHPTFGTLASPALGRADIPRLAAATGTTVGTTDEQKETVARALADVTQTRTWGLFIDVIAQTGRYPPNAAALKDFVVEGEKRYWLHIAIDRFTGEVVDQQLEAVFE